MDNEVRSMNNVVNLVDKVAHSHLVCGQPAILSIFVELTTRMQLDQLRTNAPDHPLYL